METKMKKIISVFMAFCIVLSIITSCSHIHDYGEWTITKRPTCTEVGEQERSCSCGEKQTQVVPSTGHSFGEWKTIKNSTCTEDGEQERYCSCGEKQTQVVPSTGHSFGEWSISSSATCEKAGTMTRTCEICKEKETQTIPATGHIANSNNICTVCGKNLGKEKLVSVCPLSFNESSGSFWGTVTLSYNKSTDKFQVNFVQYGPNTESVYTYDFSFGNYMNGSGKYSTKVTVSGYGNISSYTYFSVSYSGGSKYTVNVPTDPSLSGVVSSCFKATSSSLNQYVYNKCGFYLLPLQ